MRNHEFRVCFFKIPAVSDDDGPLRQPAGFCRYAETEFRPGIPSHHLPGEDLPIDQLELLALIAPRPLAVGTATLDFNADPKGEFLACRAASEVYGLFGSAGLPAETMPEPGRNISGDISFHYTAGPHEQTPADWAHYLDLAETFFL